MAFSEYDITINHIAGESNNGADMLSRCFHIAASSITRRKTKNLDEETAILCTVHTKLSHPGVRTSEGAINKNWDIKSFRQKIQEMRNQCKLCQEFLQSKHQYGEVSGHIITTDPWNHISSDILGPIKIADFEVADENEVFYILNIIDRCTSWATCYILTSLKPTEIIKHFKSWLKENPNPVSCLTDNGRSYARAEFKSFLDKNGIQQKFSRPYNPTRDSISERLNQTIKKVLQTNQGTPLSFVIK